MNKRGQEEGPLPTETLGIIIGIICIIGLIVFIVYLYNNYSQNKQLVNANSSLNNLVNMINSGASQAEIYNPNNWFLSSWPHDFGSTKNIFFPKLCSNNGWKKCLCICSQETACGEGGVIGTCLQSDFSVSGDVLHSILIQNPPLLLSIDQKNKIISVGAVNG